MTTGDQSLPAGALAATRARALALEPTVRATAVVRRWTMQTRGNSHPAAPAMDWTFRKFGPQAKRLGAHILALRAICADAYAAAARYEELSILCKQELERRGILRGDLPRHILDI